MIKEVLSLDIDGVIAGGSYIPDWDRYPEHYLKLPLVDPYIPAYIQALAKYYNIYLVSTRRYKDALSTTRAWLMMNNIDLGLLSGVIVGIPRLMKCMIVEALTAVAHIDDDLTIVKSILGGKGILYWSDEWHYRPKDYEGVSIVGGWDEIVNRLSHPYAEQLALNFGGNNENN